VNLFQYDLKFLVSSISPWQPTHRAIILHAKVKWNYWAMGPIGNLFQTQFQTKLFWKEFSNISIMQIKKLFYYKIPAFHYSTSNHKTTFPNICLSTIYQRHDVKMETSLTVLNITCSVNLSIAWYSKIKPTFLLNLLSSSGEECLLRWVW
jgi:hypothetical protein